MIIIGGLSTEFPCNNSPPIFHWSTSPCSPSPYPPFLQHISYYSYEGLTSEMCILPITLYISGKMCLHYY